MTLGSGRSKITGHSWAISTGQQGSITVTQDRPCPQVKPRTPAGEPGSQAVNAGSIPVTRSLRTEGPVSAGKRGYGPFAVVSGGRPQPPDHVQATSRRVPTTCGPPSRLTPVSAPRQRPPSHRMDLFGYEQSCDTDSARDRLFLFRWLGPGAASRGGAGVPSSTGEGGRAVPRACSLPEGERACSRPNLSLSAYPFPSRRSRSCSDSDHLPCSPSSPAWSLCSPRASEVSAHWSFSGCSDRPRPRSQCIAAAHALTRRTWPTAPPQGGKHVVNPAPPPRLPSEPVFDIGPNDVQ